MSRIVEGKWKGTVETIKVKIPRFREHKIIVLLPADAELLSQPGYADRKMGNIRIEYAPKSRKG